MLPLFLIVHIFVGTTLAGSAVVAVLVVGLDTWQPLVLAAILGFLASFPISWIVARKLREL